MDPTGVSAAAYAITNQMYSLGLVVMLAIQATGATLVRRNPILAHADLTAHPHALPVADPFPFEYTAQSDLRIPAPYNPCPF
eukprot:scaffold9061_cov124-Isochrysis_galbana.AAC.1